MPKRDIVIEHVLCDARRKRICMYVIALRGDSMRYSICTFLRYKAISSKVQMKVKFNNENSVFLYVITYILSIPFPANPSHSDIYISYNHFGKINILLFVYEFYSDKE